MAEMVSKGAETERAEVDLMDVKDTVAEELMDYDCIILGSPVYYGSCAAPIKELVDESVRFHRKLEGKVGGAFSSSAYIGGGNETTIMGILQMLMIHGMMVKGNARGNHYGPVSVGKPDNKVEKECMAYGRDLVKLTKRLVG